MKIEELNKILRTLSNRVNIYLRGEQATLNAFYDQYGTDYKSLEMTSMLANIDCMKKYSAELTELSNMIEKLNNPTKDSFTTLAPAIVALFNNIKGFNSDAKIGSVLVVPSSEELMSLEHALKQFLTNIKNMINQPAQKPLSNLDIFKNKRKKYDEDSFFTRAITKLRYLASKEKESECILNVR